MAPLPQSINVEGKELPLLTFKQLDQKPRLTLKNLAMNIRDAVGADRLPPLTAAGSTENLTCWILDVECMLAQAVLGLQITPIDLGQPANYGVSDAFMGGPNGSLTGGPKGFGTDRALPEFNAESTQAAMSQAAATKAKNQRGSNIFGGDDEPRFGTERALPEFNAESTHAAMSQAAATKVKNQRGSNIFGGDDERAMPKQQQRQPMQPMQTTNADMAAYEAAMDQAAATRARNQRGSDIFG